MSAAASPAPAGGVAPAGTMVSAPHRPRLALWRDVGALLAEFARAHPVAFGASVAVQLTNVRAGLYLAATSAIVDAMARASLGEAIDTQRLALWFALWGALQIFERVYWFAQPVLSTYLGDHGVHRVYRRILARSSAAPLIEFEVGEFFDRLQRAAEGHGWRLLNVYQQLIELGRASLSVASMVVTLGVIHPLLLPLLLVGNAPALWFQMRLATAVYAATRAHTAGDRRREHIQTLLTGQGAAGEIRLFGSADYLIDRWRALRLSRRKDALGAERRRARRHAVGNLVAGAAYAGALVLVVRLIMGGQLSIGAYVAVATGALWFQGYLNEAISALRALEEQSYVLGDLFEYLRTVREEGEGGTTGDHAEPLRGGEPTPAGGAAGGALSVDLTGVSFFYPGRSEPILKNVDLRIPAGQRVAIVGENGAGKTTLAKLMIGLYAPTTGSVRLGGIETTDGGALTVRRRIAAVFQDYWRCQFTARENIGFGDVSRIDDLPAIRAAAQRAGIDAFLESLPKGYESFLGRQFGETDLSGGQWQRIALARAFFRDADLLVLDEPTAALDPLAELELFERFADLTRGRTAIMISHRLGAARLADRVLVMQGGEIVEDGEHDALLRVGGKYARLFASQAQWYR